MNTSSSPSSIGNSGNISRNSCGCAVWGDRALIPQSHDSDWEKLLRPLAKVHVQDKQRWWRYMTRCAVCNRPWLVAGDVRIHDNYLVKRLNEEAFASANEGDAWPPDWERFEDMLAEEVAHGAVCRFADEQNDSLAATVDLLREQNSQINAERIAYLLNIHIKNAEALLAKSQLSS